MQNRIHILADAVGLGNADNILQLLEEKGLTIVLCAAGSDPIAAERARCEQIAQLHVDEHIAASEGALRLGNHTGALTRARQAQTASAICREIREGKYE